MFLVKKLKYFTRYFGKVPPFGKQYLYLLLQAMNSPQHRFDLCAWRVIKEFVGIYGIKMDYSKISKLSTNKLSKAYFEDGKLPLIEEEVSLTAKFNAYGKVIWSQCDASKHRAAFAPKSSKDWKALILRRAGLGHKNRKFYEALAKLLQPPSKVSCICGLKISSNANSQLNHYRTSAHVNRMLQCVPVSKVVNSTVPMWDSVGNCHTLVVRKWSNQHRRYLRKQIDLRYYMKQREITQGLVLSTLPAGMKLSNKKKKEINWDETYFTMGDILIGGWYPC